MQCTAINKRTKTRCQRYAIKGKDKCYQHGGATPIKHGLYSKYRQSTNANRIEENLQDKNLLNLRNQIALIVTLIQNYLEKFEDMPKELRVMESLANMADKVSSMAERLHRIENGDTLNINIKELKVIVIQIQTIILKHISDPVVKNRIAHDLKEIGL
ncbi:hypothetical protein KKC91_09375 [bacterium]|nr:hypothetical protein [bacterium]